MQEMEKARTAAIQAKKKLDNLEDLSPEERLENLDEFNEKGYFSLPATHIANQSGHVMELKPDTMRINDDDKLLSEIPLEHLTQEKREKVLDIFRKNIDILSRSEWDVGKCTSITADIELKPEAKKKCHNCVFIPIAPQISQQIDDILDSMVKAGHTKIY